jgi:hypothetical protein
MGAGADDIAVRQEALVGVGVDLLGDPLLEEAALPQGLGEALGEPVVVRRGGAAEVVPRQAEPAAEVVLNGVLLGAEGRRSWLAAAAARSVGVPCSSVAQI